MPRTSAKVVPLRAIIVATCPGCREDSPVWVTDTVTDTDILLRPTADDFWVCPFCGLAHRFELTGPSLAQLGIRTARRREIAAMDPAERTTLRQLQRHARERVARTGPN